MGGLGNQMFQYALAITLKEIYPNEDIYIDTHHYKYNGYKIHQGFEIYKVFPNANIPQANWTKVAKLSYFIPNFWLSRVVRKIFPIRKYEFRDNMHYCYYPLVANMNHDCYYDGYWQSYKYFLPYRDRILHAYSHREPNEYNKNMIQRMESCNSVGIHVRRGDYKTSPQFYGICDLDYYKKAIKQAKAKIDNPFFFIFSDDVDWCKKNISPIIGNSEINYVTENRGVDSYWDMLLLSHCRNLIIANSSFSWWGAFLNKQTGLIFCPPHWVNRNEKQETPLEYWIKII